jgi:hypothetical protein
MWAVCAIGLRVNGTDSEPIGRASAAAVLRERLHIWKRPGPLDVGQPGVIRWALFRTAFENNDSIGNRAGYNMEIKRMEENQGENTTIEENIDRKLQEGEIPGCEVEFDPDEPVLLHNGPINGLSTHYPDVSIS